jgi:hypothetical protein
MERHDCILTRPRKHVAGESMQVKCGDVLSVEMQVSGDDVLPDDAGVIQRS